MVRSQSRRLKDTIDRVIGTWQLASIAAWPADRMLATTAGVQTLCPTLLFDSIAAAVACKSATPLGHDTVTDCTMEM